MSSLMNAHSDFHQLQGETLLNVAREAIVDALQMDVPTTDQVDKTAPWLFEPAATFITLMQHGRIRGCIGSLKAHQALLDNVCCNAVSAALHDTRFFPVTADEFVTIDVEVSLLSALQPLGFTSESDALATLSPHVDGVMLEYGNHRSTFLPQVWESLPQPREFLAQLKLKAGLPENFWDESIQLSRYTVQKWRETDFIEEKK